MRVFVDTSAVYALLNDTAAHHLEVAAAWRDLTRAGAELVTTNYILLELFALLQRRLGLDAVRALHSNLTPLLQVAWINEYWHQAGMTSLLAANRRNLSLVDCIPFNVMRDLDLHQALTLDQHFAEQGFICSPTIPSE